MANHKSAKKRIIQNNKRRIRNVARKSRIKTFTNYVLVALEEQNYEKARQAVRVAESEIMKGVSKGVIKLNTASRRVSRLVARVKKLNKELAS